MKKLKLLLLIILSSTFVGCMKDSPLHNKKGEMGFNKIGVGVTDDSEYMDYIKVLENFTTILSRKVNGNNSIIKSFKLTDMGNDRKVSIEFVTKQVGIKNELQKLKLYFPYKRFVLVMWEKWYKKWKMGKVEPYFTFDPLKEENQIKTVKLYKNGKLIKKINIDDFDKYPIIVLSPEWWEGDTDFVRGVDGIKEVEKNSNFSKPYYLIPYIEGLYISRCFDPYFWGGCGAMEIYVLTWNDSNVDTIDETDFTEVDWPNRWYLPTCSDISCNINQGFHRRVFYHSVTSDTFFFKIMEKDGGLRFNDDVVGFYREQRLGGPHYIPGSSSKIWIFIDFPYNKK